MLSAASTGTPALLSCWLLPCQMVASFRLLELPVFSIGWRPENLLLFLCVRRSHSASQFGNDKLPQHIPAEPFLNVNESQLAARRRHPRRRIAAGGSAMRARAPR